MFLQPAQLPTALVGDPSRLRQVLLNLGNNAVKFTERGEVEFAVELVERLGQSIGVRFEVRDTGIGMSAEEQLHLFQPFTQGDSSTSRRYGGTGLGLSISQHLVRRMGGEIAVESFPGQGSRFHFELHFGLPGELVAPVARSAEGLRGKRVLVVDDNACARGVLVAMSAALGLQAESAADGDDALRRVELADPSDQPYDLMLIDWKMPGLDGVECVRQLSLRGPPRHPRPAVMMVTASGREAVLSQLEERHLDVGALLIKPVTPRTLLDACQQALGLTEPAPTRSAMHEEALLDHRGRLRGARILLVEDNAINREIALTLLQNAGIDATVACDGREALAILERRQFDGILMDCQMPVMDGYAATRALRRRPEWRDLPVIAMTADALIGDRDKALAAGMNDHVAKPIDVEVLFDTLARWIRPMGVEHKDPSPDAGEEPAQSVGIDRQAGIAAMMGDEAMYDRFLRMFCDQEADFPERFRATYAAGQRVVATRLAHDLKSVSASLALGLVQKAAADLEMACVEDGDDTKVEILVSKVAQALEPVIAELQMPGTRCAS